MVKKGIKVMIRTFCKTLVISVMIASAWAPLASAHVIVTPKQAGVAEETTFSISVPNEKDVSMTELTLDIPSGVGQVTPTVHPGWTITTDKANGDGSNVTRITWQSGEIPAGQRDDFTFQAQAPKKAGELHWKAYQTYVDGSTVSWDQAPVANAPDNDSAEKGPYSVTTVKNDINTHTQSTQSTTATVPLMASLLALVISVFAYLRSRK